MTGLMRGETGQSSHGQGPPPDRRPEGREALGKRSCNGADGADRQGLGPRARVGVRPLSRSGLASADLFARATMMPAGPRR